MNKEIKKIGIGVIGAGSVAEIAHFPSIAQIPEAELIAVCDTVDEYRKKAVKKWKAKADYRDYQKMIARDDISLVIINRNTFFFCSW